MYDCQWDNSLQETKMTQKVTTIGPRTAFNNEQSLYCILLVRYKRPRNDDVKQFKQKTNGLSYVSWIGKFDTYILFVMSLDDFIGLRYSERQATLYVTHF